MIMNDKFAIVAENLCFSYSDDKETLTDINLKIKEGEFVSILGSNGSGKSTFAKLINGLISPSSGDLKVMGLSVLDKSNLFEIRKNAGMVFQNPDNQMIATIVEDDIAFGPENIGIKREEIGERIDYALKAVGMEEFRNATPHRLSGGQKQRIAIAGVLAIKPRILILDESTSMLDPKGRKEVIEVARRLNREEGITIINITHFMDEAGFCDRVIILSNGKILLEGEPSDVFSRQALLESVNLSLPKAMLLAKTLKSRGLPIPNDILFGEDLAEVLCELLQKN